MELKLIKTYDYKHRKGMTMVIDRILFDSDFASSYKVRVVNIWATPRYLDLGWFVKSS